MKIELPDLEYHRSLLQSKGANFPLKTIKSNTLGLLSELPGVAPGLEGWPWTIQVDPSVYKDMDVWPKLTIVMPSYNQVKFVEQTIRSVLLQNYLNLEFIVVDGGSTDGSADIIKRYSSWISFWQSKKDQGQSNAINIGFSIASGDYYAWVNSDDYYLNGTFCKVINRFLNKKADFVYGYAYEYLTVSKKFNLLKHPPFLDYFIRLPILIQPTCFWKASIHQPLWEELHCSLDYELWIRMIKGKRKNMIKEPLSVANVHIDAKTSDPKMKAAWQKDHELICSVEAHGQVYDWNRIILLYKIYNIINSLV